VGLVGIKQGPKTGAVSNGLLLAAAVVGRDGKDPLSSLVPVPAGDWRAESLVVARAASVGGRGRHLAVISGANGQVIALDLALKGHNSTKKGLLQHKLILPLRS
jgi:hypothetical protein